MCQPEAFLAAETNSFFNGCDIQITKRMFENAKYRYTAYSYSKLEMTEYKK